MGKQSKEAIREVQEMASLLSELTPAGRAFLNTFLDKYGLKLCAEGENYAT